MRSLLSRPRKQATLRALLEALEPRRLFATTTISSGSGEGSLSVEVDSYGTFGSSTTAGNAFYTPRFAGSAAGTTFESGIFFGPLGDFLTESDFGAVLPGVSFSSTTPDTAVSQFNISRFGVQLTQTVETPNTLTDTTTLVQTYVLTNNTGAVQDFVIVRHIDGDLNFIGSFDNDFGGVSPDGRFLFEFDTASDPTEAVAYIGITDGGDGTPAGYTLQPYNYVDNIRNANGIPAGDLNEISGDANLDQQTDNGYDVTLSQARQYLIEPGQSMTYVTRTVFGRGSPVVLLSPGEFNVNADLQEIRVNENAGTVDVFIDRVNGVGGTVTIDYTVIPITATPDVDYTPITGTLTFETGVAQQFITIPILDDSLAEGDEQFFVSISNPTGEAVLGGRPGAPVTIVENDSLVQIRNTEYTVAENGGFVTLTAERLGGTLGELLVTYTTADGTAVAGQDYVATTSTFTLASGQVSTTFTVPVLTDTDVTEATETFTVSLVSAVGAGQIAPQSTATVNVTNVDKAGPTVLRTDLVASGSRIRAVKLTYSEPIFFFPEIKNYGLFDRGSSGPITGSPKSVRIRSISYDPASNTVTVTPRNNLKANRFYQVTASGAGGITDRVGNALDGDANNTNGGQFSAYFARGTSISFAETDTDRVKLRIRGGGVIQVIAQQDWTTRSLAVLGGDADSFLTGSLSRRSVFGDGRSIFSSIQNTTGVSNELDPAIFLATA